MTIFKTSKKSFGGVRWLIMNSTGQKISGILPDGHRGFELIENSSVISMQTQECFEIWGYLVYSQEISEQICQGLTNKKLIPEN